jgi:hypothetical protein
MVLCVHDTTTEFCILTKLIMASTVPESLTVTGFCDYVDQFSGPTRVNVMIDWNRVIGETFV